mmetsp:Transcript_51174/g.121619  ORF Transcript_51174/g.121619 Transcript_51174/m.121619 type:complete len:234 (-) Transcript_51174:32-733(-)
MASQLKVLLFTSVFASAFCIKDVNERVLKEEPSAKKAVMRKEVGASIDFGDGLTFQEKKQGNAETFPSAGDRVRVHYTTMLDGTKLDSSRNDWNEPYEFTMGSDDVVEGWNKALPKLSLGQRGVLHVPASLAYGSEGVGAVVPPGSDLDYDIEVVGINGNTVPSEGEETEASGTLVGGALMKEGNADVDLIVGVDSSVPSEANSNEDSDSDDKAASDVASGTSADHTGQADDY